MSDLQALVLAVSSAVSSGVGAYAFTRGDNAFGALMVAGSRFTALTLLWSALSGGAP